MRLRVVATPDRESYLVVLDDFDPSDPGELGSIRALSGALQESSGGRCHGVLAFPERVELE